MQPGSTSFLRVGAFAVTGDRVPSVPTPEPSSAAANRPRDEWNWLGWRMAVTFFVLTIFVFGGNPIPSGKDNRDKARAFVKERYPDRPLSPDAPYSTAGVAVVFSLIRSGDNAAAREAI